MDQYPEECRDDTLPRATSCDMRMMNNVSFENASFEYHDYDSGTSTIPLTRPMMRNGDKYFQLVNDSEPSQATPMYQLTDMQRSPISDVSTDMSILSAATSTYFPEFPLPSTSACKMLPRLRRKSTPTADMSRFNFNCPISCHGSGGTSSYCSPIHSPSPFLKSLVSGYPDADLLNKANSFWLQPRVTLTKPDSPTSISFKFQLPSLSEHYVSPINNKTCDASNSSPLISPPKTPDLNNRKTEKYDHHSTKLLQNDRSENSYINESIMNDESYTPPQSNETTPENANSLTHDGSFRPRRSSSFDTLPITETSGNRYINMSPYKKEESTPEGVGYYKFHLSDLGRSEGSIDRLGVKVTTSSSRETHRLSGVSDLSAMSGMTAPSTLDLNFLPMHSSC